MNLDERGQLGIFLMLIVGAIALVVLTVMLLVGISLVGSTAADLGDTGEKTNKTATPDPITGTAVSFEDTSGGAEIHQVFQVLDSTGNAVRLTGADDSYVQSDSDFDIAKNDNWTVSTWARVNDSAGSKNMTALSADGRVLIQYNGSQGNWSVWYFDDGSTDSFRVNVSAPNQPGNYSWVAAHHNGTHLTIFRNTTQGDIANTTQSNIASVSVNSTNWNGSLDETRTFDDPLNSSERSDVVNSPVHPRPETNRTARIMYDQRSGNSYPIYFTSTSATASNFTRVEGLEGHELTDGTDYTIDQDSGSITALDGGRIDGAPVVWIDYEFSNIDDVGEVANAMKGAYQLFGAGVLLIPGVAILAVLVGGLVAATQFVEVESGRQRGR